jgi:hypothetical protein
METEVRLSALRAGQASAAETVTGGADSASAAVHAPFPALATPPLPAVSPAPALPGTPLQQATGAAPQQTETGGSPDAAEAPQRERRGDIALADNPAYRPASFRRNLPQNETEQAARAAGMAGVEPLRTAQLTLEPRRVEGFDGRELRNVQVELRGLRADVAELARALGRPLRTQSSLTEYRGVLQQYDHRDSDVQRMWYEQELAQQPGAEHQLERAARQAEGRQLSRKQEELLGALRRAERRLEEAPEQVLPPGVREAVIGEILRARYSAAVFGGLSGSALVTGRLANLAA